MYSKDLDIIHQGNKLFVIAGPCAIEGRDMAFRIAEEIKEICGRLDIPFIFKGSFKKANRSKADSFMGIGDEKALGILKDVGDHFKIATTTDIHESEDAIKAAQSVDVLQIPAFLCRQTELIQAAAETGKVINIKKGQFMSPESMRFAANKVREVENSKVWLTERGTTFGYQDLVVDFRSIPTMKQYCDQVVMDCTHSLQQPNQSKGVTGGRPELISTMAKAAVAVGAQGLFIETHYNPPEAKSDAANMLPLDRLESILTTVKNIHSTLREGVPHEDH
jgi:2-dehydro-3-deoxyphosphooctonate aldolase (KDO 8-P synthase)